METALHSFLLSVPRAAAIWLVMLALAMLAVAVLSRPGLRLAGPDTTGPDSRGPDSLGPDSRGPDSLGPDSRGPDSRGPDSRGPDFRGPDPLGPDPLGPDPADPDGDDGSRHPHRAGVSGGRRPRVRHDRRRTKDRGTNDWYVSTPDPDDPYADDPYPDDPYADDRDWAHRYADEVEIAAERAAATAQRRRAEWERAQAAVDAAWTAFDAADRGVRRTVAAAALPVFDEARTPEEFADRERYLHRAATAACRRHELSIHELSNVLAHRNGWDPKLHPVHQEVALSKAVRDRQFMAYREATTKERQAWHTAGVAAAAVRSLREEAAAARLRLGQHIPTPGQLWWAEQWSTEPVGAEPAPEVADTVPVVSPAPVVVVGARLATR